MDGMLPKPLLFIALDYREEDANNKIYKTAEQLSSINGQFGYKLNIDAVVRYDFIGDLVKRVASLGRPVFVDMKMGNGSSTMASITRDLCSRGVKIINAWAHLGPLLTKSVKVAQCSVPTIVAGCNVVSNTRCQTSPWGSRCLRAAVAKGSGTCVKR